MDKKVLIILGVIVAIAAILLIVLFAMGSSDYTMQGNAAEVTIPANYTFDDKNYVASSEDGVNVTVIQESSPDNYLKFFGAIRDNGKDSGYENVSNKSINGFEEYEFAAHQDQLKNVSTNREVSGNYETWTEYTPEMAYSLDNPTDHFRSVTFIKDGKINELLFYTNNPNVNLYTPEIDAIINSIAPITD